MFALLTHLLAKASLRWSRDQRGQTAVEYLGVIIFVAAVIVALMATDIGGEIGRAIVNQVKKIAGSGN